jgi:hypothetical protein
MIRISVKKIFTSLLILLFFSVMLNAESPKKKVEKRIKPSILAVANAKKDIPYAKEFQSPELLKLAKEFREWRRSFYRGVPDYVRAVKEQIKGLEEFRNRLDSIDPHSWPVPDQVDYLVVLIEMNALEFDLKVIRQVSRNPDFYTMQAVQRVKRRIGGRHQRGRGITVPYDEERANAIIQALNDTTKIIKQAPKALTEAVPEMADMAIERLENVRENYAKFAQVVGQHLPDPYRSQFDTAADKAGNVLEDYRQWLVKNRQKFKAPYVIGREALDWYIRNVLAWPHNSDQLLVHAELERLRNWAFLQFERQKNRNLPRPGNITDRPARHAGSNKEYLEWKDATDVMTRIWVEKYDLFTIPDYVSGAQRNQEGGVWIEPFEMMAFPKEVPEGRFDTEFVIGPDHWFAHAYNESGHWLDPGTNHPHTNIPGHSFESTVSQRECREIRKGHRARGDSWCMYVEELQLQVDYPFIRGPIVREWMYSLAIQRAERVYVSVKLADGAMKPKEVTEHMLKTVPWMEPYVAKRHETWRLFSRPAYVLTYQVGKFEVYKLLRDMMRKLGDDFDLGEFHDQFFATGQIPVPLARWEMAGIDDDIKHLWKRESVPVKGKR